MWWKQHRWKVLVPALIVMLLAGAFWYGGNAPGARGWTVPDKEISQPIEETVEPVQMEKPTVDEPADMEQQESSTVTEEPKKEPATPTPEQETAPEQTVAQTTTPKQPEQEQPKPAQPEDQPEMVIDPETGKDQYLTDPVPEGKPLPVEPQDVTIGTTAYSCTISISCATILDNLDLCDSEKKELVPEDGWILEPMTVTFYEGESVFNVLQRTCKQQKIHMEFEDTPMYNSAYIEGIHNLYEFDVGELSGWMYSVNDWFPNYGCSRYQLQDGDIVEWVYTCDYGADVGRPVT